MGGFVDVQGKESLRFLTFKIEVVKQVTEKSHSVADVAARLGTTTIIWGLLQIIRGGIYYLVNGLKDHCKL